MSSKTFREYLYEQAFSKDVSDLEIDYSSLEKSKLTKNEIEERLSSIFRRLSNDILKKSFRIFEEYPELNDRI